jgi:hypothetical protein
VPRVDLPLAYPPFFAVGYDFHRGVWRLILRGLRENFYNRQYGTMTMPRGLAAIENEYGLRSAEIIKENLAGLFGEGLDFENVNLGRMPFIGGSYSYLTKNINVDKDEYFSRFCQIISHEKTHQYHCIAGKQVSEPVAYFVGNFLRRILEDRKGKFSENIFEDYGKHIFLGKKRRALQCIQEIYDKVEEQKIERGEDATEYSVMKEITPELLKTRNLKDLKYIRNNLYKTGLVESPYRNFPNEYKKMETAKKASEVLKGIFIYSSMLEMVSLASMLENPNTAPAETALKLMPALLMPLSLAAMASCYIYMGIISHKVRKPNPHAEHKNYGPRLGRSPPGPQSAFAP